MTLVFVYMIIIWSIATTAFGLWGAFNDIPFLNEISLLEDWPVINLILPTFVSVAIVAALSSLHHQAGKFYTRGKYTLMVFFFCGGLIFNGLSGLFASATNNLLFNNALLFENNIKRSMAGVDTAVVTVYAAIREARDQVTAAENISSRRAIEEEERGGTCIGNPSKEGPGPRMTLRQEMASTLNQLAATTQYVMADAVALRSELTSAREAAAQQSLYARSVALLDDPRLQQVAIKLGILKEGFEIGFPHPDDPSKKLVCGDPEMKSSVEKAIAAVGKKHELPTPPDGSSEPVLTDSIQISVKVVKGIIGRALTFGKINKSDVDAHTFEATTPTLLLTFMIELVCLVWAFAGGIRSNDFRNTPTRLLGRDDYGEMGDCEVRLQKETFNLLQRLTIPIMYPAESSFFLWRWLFGNSTKEIVLFLIPQSGTAHQQQAELFVRKAELKQIESARVHDVSDFLMGEKEAEQFEQLNGTKLVRIYYWNRKAEGLLKRIARNLGIRGAALLEFT